MTVKIQLFVCGKKYFSQNTYVVSCEKTRQGVFIDAGACAPEDYTAIEEYIKKEDLTIKYLINTHGHLDHIWGNAWVKQKFNPKIAIHQEDLDMLTDPIKNGSEYFGCKIQSPDAEIILKDHQKITLGELTLQVLHTPGHTPGGICLLVESYVFTGDTLFAGGIGRTDLPGGDYNTLMTSLRERLFCLPTNTICLPGHGIKTTIAHEQQLNFPLE